MNLKRAPASDGEKSGADRFIVVNGKAVIIAKALSTPRSLPMVCLGARKSKVFLQQHL